MINIMGYVGKLFYNMSATYCKGSGPSEKVDAADVAVYK